MRITTRTPLYVSAAAGRRPEEREKKCTGSQGIRCNCRHIPHNTYIIIYTSDLNDSPGNAFSPLSSVHPSSVSIDRLTVEHRFCRDYVYDSYVCNRHTYPHHRPYIILLLCYISSQRKRIAFGGRLDRAQATDELNIIISQCTRTHARAYRSKIKTTKPTAYYILFKVHPNGALQGRRRRICRT